MQWAFPFQRLQAFPSQIFLAASSSAVSLTGKTSPKGNYLPPGPGTNPHPTHPGLSNTINASPIPSHSAVHARNFWVTLATSLWAVLVNRHSHSDVNYKFYPPHHPWVTARTWGGTVCQHPLSLPGWLWHMTGWGTEAFGAALSGGKKQSSHTGTTHPRRHREYQLYPLLTPLSAQLRRNHLKTTEEPPSHFRPMSGYPLP